jgi:hypothetical protein
MDTEIGFRRIEDQPAVSDVRGRKSELVPDEGPQGFRLRRIEHRMHASNHHHLAQTPRQSAAWRILTPVRCRE